MSIKLKMVLLAVFGIAAATAAGAATWTAVAHYGIAKPPVDAPEIDVLSASSALTLLSGALLAWRGRRARK